MEFLVTTINPNINKVPNLTDSLIDVYFPTCSSCHKNRADLIYDDKELCLECVGKNQGEAREYIKSKKAELVR